MDNLESTLKQFFKVNEVKIELMGETSKGICLILKIYKVVINNDVYFCEYKEISRGRINFENEVICKLKENNINILDHIEFAKGKYFKPLGKGAIFITKWKEFTNSEQINICAINDYQSKLELIDGKFDSVDEYYKRLKIPKQKNPKLYYTDIIGNISHDGDFFFSNIGSYNYIGEKYKFCPAFVVFYIYLQEKYSEEKYHEYCDINNLDYIVFKADIIEYLEIEMKLGCDVDKMHELLKKLKD